MVDEPIMPELTGQVIARTSPSANPRLSEITAALIRHLHAFARDVSLTQAEWAVGIDFLTRAGQLCSSDRQEFILLSDVLGLSMLVDAIDHPTDVGISDSTVLGPFYAGPQRELPYGASILLRPEPGPELWMTGRVHAPDGHPIADAMVQVWQTSPNELYDVQDPLQPRGHLRATFRTDDQGRYGFRSILPVSYPIPDDGPAGQLLRALGRHPYRPAHLHFMISADGFRTLITHLFFAGDEYLDSDVVFGVKESLIVTPQPEGDGWSVRYDFGLAARS